MQQWFLASTQQQVHFNLNWYESVHGSWYYVGYVRDLEYYTNPVS